MRSCVWSGNSCCILLFSSQCLGKPRSARECSSTTSWIIAEKKAGRQPTLCILFPKFCCIAVFARVPPPGFLAHIQAFILILINFPAYDLHIRSVSTSVPFEGAPFRQVLSLLGTCTHLFDTYRDVTQSGQTCWAKATPRYMPFAATPAFLPTASTRTLQSATRSGVIHKHKVSSYVVQHSFCPCQNTAIGQGSGTLLYAKPVFGYETK